MSSWEGVIGVENKRTEDGRFIDPGAVIWDEEIPIPLYLIDAGGRRLVGIVEEVWRGDYLLLARGEFRPEYSPPEHVRALGMELHPVTFSQKDDPRELQVHEGRLRSVCLYDGVKPAWPECGIKEIS